MRRSLDSTCDEYTGAHLPAGRAGELCTSSCPLAFLPKPSWADIPAPLSPCHGTGYRASWSQKGMWYGHTWMTNRPGRWSVGGSSNHGRHLQRQHHRCSPNFWAGAQKTPCNQNTATPSPSWDMPWPCPLHTTTLCYIWKAHSRGRDVIFSLNRQHLGALWVQEPPFPMYFTFGENSPGQEEERAS